MVDLIYGRGITGIIRETSVYRIIFKKYASIKLLHAKPALYGSVEIINVCNLHCSHCYWWLNRKENDKDLTEEGWREVNKIGFQFHTPFMKDPLWIPFGEKRSKIVDNIIELRRKYPNFVINGEKQLSLMKGNWGGVGTTPIQCPSWAILSLDHMGRVKRPCCIGSADSNSLKPICEKCGLGCYSILVAQGINGGN